MLSDASIRKAAEHLMKNKPMLLDDAIEATRNATSFLQTARLTVLDRHDPAAIARAMAVLADPTIDLVDMRHSPDARRVVVEAIIDALTEGDHG